MSLRRSLVTTTLVAAFSVAATNALAGDDVTKPAVKRDTVVKEVAQNKKDSSALRTTTPRAWRRSADQPCDSTACRPFRFAWSPVAPGA